MNNRWWIYQKERFPILAHGPLVVIFCLSVMLFSSLQQAEAELLDPIRIVAAVISTLLLFFQLRVADEFKDFEIDAKYRPHRPVPSGLVSLRELARLAFAGAAIQFVIAMYIDVGLIPVLLGVWVYLGLMTKEFFVPDWLKRHPIVYLLSHMLIMPMIAFYASTFDWLCECREIPDGLGWLLATSFFCGIVLEVGRKIRTPGNERTGVETYSALWGTRIAVIVWTAAVVATAIAYTGAARYISVPGIYINMAGAVLLLASMTAAMFPRKDNLRSSKDRLLEPSSGLVAMLIYLGLGPIQAVLG